VGTIEGTTQKKRAEAAEKLAGDLHADVIVYGLVALGADQTRFAPEFFVSERKLPSAEELAGQYEAGRTMTTTGDIRVNVRERQKLRDRLLSWTGVLADFVVGLSYYANGELVDAKKYFAQAAGKPGWNGKEVLYHFQGNTALNLKELDQAEKFYTQALAENPEYARARLGKGEVLFQQSHRDCAPGSIDAAGVQAAIDGYKSALSAKDQPALADVKTKADFYLGRAYLCESLAGVEEHWLDAEGMTRAVIANFRGGNERVRDLASEAYGNLGLIYWGQQDYAQAAQAYSDAADVNQRATELGRRLDRQALFYRQESQVLQLAGRNSEAIAACAEAVRTDPRRPSPYNADCEKLKQ
jgi:tetratricopeptide (TPR) repeat protein